MINIRDIKALKNKNLIYILVSLITIFTCYGIYFSGVSYEVKVDGQKIGIVQNKNIVYNAIKDIKEGFEENVNIDQQITFDKVRVSKDKISSDQEIIEKLNSLIDIKTQAYAINVDGKDIVYLKKEDKARKLLEKIKNHYIEKIDSENIKDASFLEDVNIVKKNAKVTDIKDIESAYNFILLGTEQIKTYKVEQGDSAWTISQKLNISVEDIQKANPDINVEKLQIGQEINVSVPSPYINFKTIEIASYEEKIPYKVTQEETNALFKGERKVKVIGKEGKRKIEAEIVRVNGKIVDKNVLNEEELQKPQDQVILIGTKSRPSTVAFGAFINPTRGTLTSRFGARWGRMHEGIDIAGPIGTPIKAADGGVVSFAGTQGAYGKLVIINHENGYSTYYAHCNTINVRVGQRVSRGQVIATIGNTGRSTGPHLHFEVRKNGRPVNPLNYIRY
ncbi:Murein DD-endopeptidase MepM and murein hydrolase activator NlpD, contain LysM domain [Alkalithermobacter thermoalcaliphilus JW-YL-7 = DSM 7308]|uniref:Murein DD-endopeptidase MepM and murein hydrolase activator NlpD, contain LysM domain n=1 Tax=Alkalithermobacter thermoalcaliphilus JW-YL-7 = DSM 7308 TaxID=1121328 RepID=A0A150FT23_CLOPD|nr:Peptidase M23 [[Clostridium] paradoxum JW-YL-7 = DSM 7308]SHL09815.1 Murein DD-endopeptidase MepM and murein hydrolase activator NlpD, contain LysM domain [[Clostridium] paradoxum JW-YL-7 = DSM 7308]